MCQALFTYNKLNLLLAEIDRIVEDLNIYVWRPSALKATFQCIPINMHNGIIDYKHTCKSKMV